MSIEQLAETAQALVAPGKGIIAIDESIGTIGKRFAAVGLENTFVVGEAGLISLVEDNDALYCIHEH